MNQGLLTCPVWVTKNDGALKKKMGSQERKAI
jgi:hypothetical protein